MFISVPLDTSLLGSTCTIIARVFTHREQFVLSWTWMLEQALNCAWNDDGLANQLLLSEPQTFVQAFVQALVQAFDQEFDFLMPVDLLTLLLKHLDYDDYY